jgi:hypothetical protein
MGNAITVRPLKKNACRGEQYEIEDWVSNNAYGWDECFGAANEQPDGAHKSLGSAHRSSPKSSRVLGRYG